MKKYIVVGLLIISFILSPTLVSAQTNQSKNSCIQDCFKTYEKTCVGTGRLGVTPFCLTENEVSTKCQLICGESASAVLNSNYPMKIGQRVIIEDYDKMEITLLGIKAECIGEKTILELTNTNKDFKQTKQYAMETGAEKINSCITLKDITAILKIKKGSEEIFLNINNEESEKVFNVRIDVSSPELVMYHIYLNEETGEWEGGGVSAEPKGVVLGVYEKGVAGFWARFLSWFKRFF